MRDLNTRLSRLESRAAPESMTVVRFIVGPDLEPEEIINRNTGSSVTRIEGETTAAFRLRAQSIVTTRNQ